MEKVYKEMLKQLKRKKALLVYVNGKYTNSCSRYRVVSPTNCEFIFEIDNYYWRRSCFLDKTYYYNPESIIKSMNEYDKYIGLKILKFEVL